MEIKIEDFFPLVGRIVFKYKDFKEDIEDLRQEGLVGLVEAFYSFDPSKGYSFGTYAEKYIEGSIKHYLRDKLNTIKHPRWFRALSEKIENFILNYRREHGKIPLISDISVGVNIKEEGVREFFRIKNLISLKYFEEGESVDSIDYNYLRGKIKHRVYENFKLPIEDIITLYSAIEKLSNLQKKAIYYLFFKGYSHKETAKEIGISERHLTRIKKDAFSKLKNDIEEHDK